MLLLPTTFSIESRAVEGTAAGFGVVVYVAGIHLAGILTRAHVRRIVDEVGARIRRTPALETTGGSVRKEPA